MRLLAGDIGGTKVLLQLAEYERGNLRSIAERRFESAAYSGLLPIVREFLDAAEPGRARVPDAACFGIAGPIDKTPEGQVARVTNLPWVVEGAAVARILGIPVVRLINDFEAIAHAIETLGPKELVVLQDGERQVGAPCAVIGAGTGLGQALLVWRNDRYEAVATEGGHVDFAPTDELQIELLRYLSARHGRVSYERVLSGSGLANVYGFLRAHGRPLEEKALPTAVAPADIAGAALERSDEHAVAALQLFLKVYGAHAGNVALSYLAAGGVFIAGGIAPKILTALRDGTFIRAFGDKGRMSALLGHIPVYVVTDERAGLRGAALAATRLTGA